MRLSSKNDQYLIDHQEKDTSNISLCSTNSSHSKTTQCYTA